MGRQHNFKSARQPQQALIGFPPLERGDFGKLKILKFTIQRGENFSIKVGEDEEISLDDLAELYFVTNLLPAFGGRVKLLPFPPWKSLSWEVFPVQWCILLCLENLRNFFQMRNHCSKKTGRRSLSASGAFLQF